MWDRSRGSISLTIVWICVGVFVGIALLDMLDICPRHRTISLLGLSRMGVFRQFWVHQFLTAPLVHANVIHLLFNMLALWMLGPSVEERLGRRNYIFFSLLCAACSMVGFLIIAHGAGRIVIGYSGVIFGIFVAQAIMFPNRMILVFYFFPLRMKHAVLILGAMELYLTVSSEGSMVAHAAHLFGAVAAFLYLRLVLRSGKQKSQRKGPKHGVTQPRLSHRMNRKKIPWKL